MKRREIQKNTRMKEKLVREGKTYKKCNTRGVQNKRTGQRK